MGSASLCPRAIRCAAAAEARREHRAAEIQPYQLIGLPDWADSAARGRLIATGAALSDMTNVLNVVVGRLVVDRTGLSGPFDVNLAWTPDPALQAVIRQGDTLSVPDAPSIFTAVEEQLGLRLVSDRAPVEVMVVERLERPGPD